MTIVKTVPDHSNDHFNGDRPACEDPEYFIPVYVFQHCPKCGKFGKFTEEYVSMGDGYNEYEGKYTFECKCGTKW